MAYSLLVSITLDCHLAENFETKGNSYLHAEVIHISIHQSPGQEASLGAAKV